MEWLIGLILEFLWELIKDAIMMFLVMNIKDWLVRWFTVKDEEIEAV